MNTRYLARLGFGMTSAEFDPAVLSAFLQDRAHFARRVQSAPKQDGNAALYALVDKVLDRFETHPPRG
jgi:hypothetical protein